MQNNARDDNPLLQSIDLLYRTTFFEMIPVVDFNWLNKTNNWKVYKKLTPSSDAQKVAFVLCKNEA